MNHVRLVVEPYDYQDLFIQIHLPYRQMENVVTTYVSTQVPCIAL